MSAVVSASFETLNSAMTGWLRKTAIGLHLYRFSRSTACRCGASTPWQLEEQRPGDGGSSQKSFSGHENPPPGPRGQYNGCRLFLDPKRNPFDPRHAFEDTFFIFEFVLHSCHSSVTRSAWRVNSRFLIVFRNRRTNINDRAS